MSHRLFISLVAVAIAFSVCCDIVAVREWLSLGVDAGGDRVYVTDEDGHTRAVAKRDLDTMLATGDRRATQKEVAKAVKDEKQDLSDDQGQLFFLGMLAWAPVFALFGVRLWIRWLRHGGIQTATAVGLPD